MAAAVSHRASPLLLNSTSAHNRAEDHANDMNNTDAPPTLPDGTQLRPLFEREQILPGDLFGADVRNLTTYTTDDEATWGVQWYRSDEMQRFFRKAEPTRVNFWNALDPHLGLGTCVRVKNQPELIEVWRGGSGGYVIDSSYANRTGIVVDYHDAREMQWMTRLYGNLSSRARPIEVSNAPWVRIQFTEGEWGRPAVILSAPAALLDVLAEDLTTFGSRLSAVYLARDCSGPFGPAVTRLWRRRLMSELSGSRRRRKAAANALLRWPRALDGRCLLALATGRRIKSRQSVGS